MGPSSSLYLAMESIHAVTTSVSTSDLFFHQGSSAFSVESAGLASAFLPSCFGLEGSKLSCSEFKFSPCLFLLQAKKLESLPWILLCSGGQEPSKMNEMQVLDFL